MPVDRLEHIFARCPQDTALLGLDIGKKTVGMAVSNRDQTIAMPLRTIRRVKFTRDIEQIEDVIRSHDVGGYILGYPLNIDGSVGPRADACRHFGEEMLNHPNIFGRAPFIALWDERLSTVSVEDFLVETVDMSRTKREQVVDKLAAQVILQGALDFMSACARPNE